MLSITLTPIMNDISRRWWKKNYSKFSLYRIIRWISTYKPPNIIIINHRTTSIWNHTFSFSIRSLFGFNPMKSMLYDLPKKNYIHTQSYRNFGHEPIKNFTFGYENQTTKNMYTFLCHGHSRASYTVHIFFYSVFLLCSLFVHTLCAPLLSSAYFVCQICEFRKKMRRGGRDKKRGKRNSFT